MERKRELFKRYLEERRVMDTLSKLVVSLYERPEKPADPLTYIRDYFAVDTGGVDIATVRQENIDMTKKLADLNANISDFVKEYYVLIMEEYETFFKTFKIKYEYIDTEEDGCILLGSLTKDVKYNPTMILDYSFPINYKLSENYNKLMMLIFENINSNEFNFNILNYRFLTL